MEFWNNRFGGLGLFLAYDMDELSEIETFPLLIPVFHRSVIPSTSNYTPREITKGGSCGSGFLDSKKKGGLA
jgi:hypothetical protein